MRKPARNEPARHAVECELAEGKRPGRRDLAGDARHEQNAAKQMDRGIAQPGPACGRSRAPDHERRGDCHQLPENEHGEQVAREEQAMQCEL